MKTLHYALSGNSFRGDGAGFGNIDETEGAVLILTLIAIDLCPTQRTGAIEIHHRFRKL
jgi:hypothetical protein